MRLSSTGNIEGRMYMRIEGITGDVLTPHVYMGQILLETLIWFGARLSPNEPRSAVRPVGKNEIGGFPDFPFKDRKAATFKVLCARGRHTPDLTRMAMSGGDARDATIWIPAQHRKPLLATFKGVTVAGLEAWASSTGGVMMDYITFEAASGQLRVY